MPVNGTGRDSTAPFGHEELRLTCV